jgi:hypothetical protein
VHFVVVPNARQYEMGLWIDAADQQEARRLIARNVPGCENVTKEGYATCVPDNRFTPPYGVIVDGSGQTFTVSQR